MGPSLQVCLNALDVKGDHAASDAGELHILERTSLKFLAQNCILAQAPNLTRFKVSGSLPTLQLNFSDRKYKSLMRMIDVALPKFDDPANSPTTRPPAQPMPRHTSFAQSRNKVVSDEEDDDLQVGGDTDTEGESDSEDEKEGGTEEEFYDTPDIVDGVRPFLSGAPSVLLTPVDECRSRMFTKRLSSSLSPWTAFRRPSSGPMSIQPSPTASLSTPSSRVSSSASSSARST